MREVLSRWYGVFVLEDGKVVASRAYGETTLADRMRQRHSGDRTPEEDELLQQFGSPTAWTRDRRLQVPAGPTAGGVSDAPAFRAVGFSDALRRATFLEVAESELTASWDPSVHVEEAVRALSELDPIANQLGERIASWTSRDLAESVEAEVSETPATPSGSTGPPVPAPTAPDAELDRARRALMGLYRDVARVRAELETAITDSVPRRAPNLSALLGPILAGRLIALAGGLDRLARLPSSTIQVLGAERAFFEHLRGQAPPPRHGVLFLHPTIQTAPRRQRGRLARALAGKVAIAARLDRSGGALRPDLGAAYEARARAIRSSSPPKPAAGHGRRGRSGPPLDRAALDR